ncbi:MAG: iron ABC transporter substrate-binding protein [Rhodobacterales bacterium]|nr:MAG: iron ABC transporter substrate-binding protein [Rhodobacterales bacterium]
MSMRHALLASTTLLASAAAADVNIYTTRQPSLIEPVVQGFTDATGINVNLAYVDGAIAEKLKAEGARSPADLVMTVDIANLAQVVDAGVVAPLQNDALESAIPATLRDPDGKWFAVTTRARVIYASKERVADGEVTTYEDLTDPKWEGRICTRSGTHNYNLALLSAVIAHHGEEAAKTWAEGLKANLARKPQGNDRAQVKAIWAGECDISIGNTYYMGAMLGDAEQTEWANSVRLVFPTFDDGGSHVNISGVSLLEGAPHRDEAIQFLEYLVSPEAQAIYAEANFEYPVLEEAALSDLVASWGEITPDSIALSEIAAHRAAALRIMEEVDFDG